MVRCQRRADDSAVPAASPSRAGYPANAGPARTEVIATDMSDESTPGATEAPPAPVDGEAAARFAPVREAFAKSFEDLGEVGAAFCLRLGGEVVVDVWGGWQDAERTRPWQRDTLVNAYSVGKGVLAGLLMCVVEEGRLSFDDRVVEVWPEFGAHGKDGITVRMLSSHQAGLPALREKLDRSHLYDWAGLCERLADEEPYWTPGTAHGYHVNMYGFLVGEVIHRATGMPVAEALSHYMTGPAGADFFFSVPDADHARCTDMLVPNYDLDSEEKWAIAFPPTGDRDFDVMKWHTYFNPPGISGVGSVHTAEWKRSVIPSTSGHATARAVAALYAGMMGSGVELAVTPGARVRGEATRGEVDGDDVILQRPSRFGIGFQLPIPTRPLWPSASAFGHYGYGGALGFADPENDLAFGYLMNLPGDRWQTPRTQRLIDTVYDCL